MTLILMEQEKIEFGEALNKNLFIYWWNMGTKKIDHKGTYKEFFEKREIKIRRNIKHPITGEKCGTRFYMPIGSSIITFDTFGGTQTPWEYAEKFNNAIKLFLTYLGDKSLLLGNNREYKINWR